MKKRLIILNRVHADGTTPLYLNVEYDENGKRKQKRINTGVKINPKKWSKKKGVVLASHPHADELNEELKFFFDNYKPEFEIQKPKATERKKDITSYLDEYIDFRKARGDKNTSYKEFTTVKNRMVEYQKSILKKIYFEDINLVFSDDLIAYMSKLEYDPNTIKKHFVTFKTFLNHYYKRKDDLDISLSADFLKKDFGSVSTHASPPMPLTSGEFRGLVGRAVIMGFNAEETLTDTEWKVADLMLLQCTTGLRFSDLFRITKDKIKNGILYIEPTKTERTKKDNLCRIPLNEYSINILKKFDWDTTNQKMSIQKYNEYIKKVAKKLKFNDEIVRKKYNGLGTIVEEKYKKHEILSSHNMRDTFITMCIKVKIDIPSIMKMTGQNSWAVMEKYVKLDDDHLIEGMNQFTAENLTKVNIPDFLTDRHHYVRQIKKSIDNDKETSKKMEIIKKEYGLDFDW